MSAQRSANAAVLRQFVADRSVCRRVLEPENLGRLIALVADDGFGAATGS